MQLYNGELVYSATDLNNYLECAHLVALSRRIALGELVKPQPTETVALIADKGLQRESDYLAALRARHPDIVEILQADGSFAGTERAAAQTLAAMEKGASVIYQGTFFDGTFLGKSDFLLRVDVLSARWPWSYEVVDTKLALADKPYFIIQLCHYSEHVARVQGTPPHHMHVVLGSGVQKTYRFDDFAAYYRHLKASFLRTGASGDAYPLRCSHCTICNWAAVCERRRERDDHLSLVASMRRDDIARFEAAGITTVKALATGGERPEGMHENTYLRLRRQAALQVRGRENRDYYYELLEPRPAEGFALLPAPSPGDVYFDMEGDPFYEIGKGLEYLFGCYCPRDEPPFHAFWGTDREGEKQAFERCIDFLMERRQRYASMHIYHYASYEKTALRKLAQRHGTREEAVDLLLQSQALVDLYAVVRQSLMISQPSYSIKKLEPFYGMRRQADVRQGDDSVVKFELWLKDRNNLAALEEIERYNEEDCRSTHLLHDWLLQRREEFGLIHGGVPDFRALKKHGDPCHDAFTEGCKKCLKRESDAREQAAVTRAGHALLARAGDPTAQLLAALLSYHRREDKSVWWAFFDRCENLDQLLEFDKDALAGLQILEEEAPFKASSRDRNLVYTYAFPEQTYHLPSNPHDPRTQSSAGAVHAIDEALQRISIRRGGTPAEAAALHEIIPGGPVRTEAQKSSLGRIGAAYLDGRLPEFSAVALDILNRTTPRLGDRVAGSRIQPQSVSEQAVLDVVAALDNSYLFVQGPPGSGKTYTGARVIVDLLAAGKKIGVMAQSHKAMHNLLHEVESVADARRVFLRGFHKHSDTNDGSPFCSKLPVPLIASGDDNDAAQSDEYNLVSGNGWLFAREGMSDRLDYLFVDEAGQVSLADAVAVAPCAKNMVLLGDPMQLAQVSQGSHPAAAGVSVLEHVLGDAATVPEDRGILLDTSYRMPPQLCAFISGVVYDGRLKPDPSALGNGVTSSGLRGSGLRYVPVEHAGNGRESVEEAQRIVDEIGLLLGGTVIVKAAPPRRMTESDILVVTPYNAQQRRIEGMLRNAGYAHVEVGTVNKFQGREAPVVFYSMASSTGEDAPRSMEFLFEKNRFNVAVSRAQCLSVLVCSPKLLQTRCNHAEQMALVNVLCRYVEPPCETSIDPVLSAPGTSTQTGKAAAFA